MHKLEDSQIWESEKCIIQIQSLGKGIFDFKGIIFEKNKDEILRFNNVLYNEKNRLIEFIKSLNMKLVEKKIITKRKKKNDGKE